MGGAVREELGSTRPGKEPAQLYYDDGGERLPHVRAGAVPAAKEDRGERRIAAKCGSRPPGRLGPRNLPPPFR